MSYNAGLLYYRHYYSGVDFSNHGNGIERHNGSLFYQNHKTLYAITFPGEMPFVYPDFGNNTFELTTTNPGLLLGSGYAHGSGLLGEMKIGFYFDHTTGLPVIPGSSIKGVLRSVFPGQYRKAAQKHQNKAATLTDPEKKAAEKRFAEQLDYKARLCEQFITKMLLKILKNKNPQPEVDATFVESLENEIFGRTDAGDNGIPMSGRDIFHDAVPVRSTVPSRVLRLERVGETEAERNDRLALRENLPAGTLFADDFITPHKNRSDDGLPDAVKNPVPVGFLKVLPGVVFRFQFDLKDSSSPMGISADQKRTLFKEILLFRGVGAKTNTGYGQFDDPASQIANDAEATRSQQKISSHPGPEKIATEKVYKPFRKGEIVEAVVVEHPGTPAGHIALKLFADAPGKEPVAFYRFPAGRAPGTIAKSVRIEEIKPPIKISVILW